MQAESSQPGAFPPAVGKTGRDSLPEEHRKKAMETLGTQAETREGFLEEVLKSQWELAK